MFVGRLLCLEHHAALRSQSDDDRPTASLQQLLPGPVRFFHISYWETGEQLCLLGGGHQTVRWWQDSVSLTSSISGFFFFLFSSVPRRQVNQLLGIKIKDRAKPALAWDTGRVNTQLHYGNSPRQKPQYHKTDSVCNMWSNSLISCLYRRKTVCFVP